MFKYNFALIFSLRQNTQAQIYFAYNYDGL